MRVNFRGVQKSSGGFEPIPPGEYHCRVRSAEEKANYLQLEFEVLDEPYVGRKVVDRLFATERAMPRFQAALTAMGFAADGLVEINPQHLIGREVHLTVEIDNYTDRNGVDRRGTKVAFAGYRAVEPAPPPRPAQRATQPGTARPGGFQARADKDLPF